MNKGCMFFFLFLFTSLTAKSYPYNSASYSLPAPATLYTYQSGAWDNIDVWTTDPGGTTLVGSKVPEDGDAVVILPSRVLTLRNGNVTNTGLDITIQEGGILDDSIYTFTQTLSALRGKGTLKLKNTSFPAAGVNTFVASGGGTVEYYINSADYNLPAQSVYNNLIINSPGRAAIQTADITLNGNLIIRNGAFRINDNSSARRTLTIHGSLTVDAGASLLTGSGNTTTTTDPASVGTGGTAPFLDYYTGQSHRIEIYGDFTNNGTVKFTNQNFPVFNAFPNNGFASVFFRGPTNNTLTCNGTTDFYNIILDKGSDQTFILTVNSAGYDKFRLFGANNAAEFAGADVNNPNLRKSLWIRTGTLKLNGYVYIPSLVEGSAGGGDFYIPGNGALIMDGPDVVVMGTIDDYSVVNLAYGVSGGSGAVNGVTTDPSVVPSGFSLYGKLQVNDGNLYIGEIGRLIYYGTATAEFVINGGIIDVKQFQSVSGGGKTAYWQTGGNLILRGRFKRTLIYTNLTNMIASIGNLAQLNTTRATIGTDPNVGTFNIDQDANIFHMEGGNISIYDVSGSTGTPRALEINSDPANINVTGGNINIIMTTGNAGDANYGIASKAGIFNLNINRNSGSSSSVLLTIPAKSGVTGVANPPLIVLNNLTLTDATGSANSVLNSGNFDVKVGGNFNIQSNAEYTPGSNITVLNGSGAQTMINSGTILGGGLNKFFIDKNSGTATLGSNLTVRDSLAIFGGTLNDGGFTLQVAGNLYNAGIHTGTGKIQLNGSVIQYLSSAISAGSPVLGNLEITNTSGANGSTVAALQSHFSVNSLTLTSNRVINIGSYGLTVGPGGISTGLTYSLTRMILTNGLSSDGGLKRYIDNSFNGQTILFPVGCPGGARNPAVAYFPGRIYLGTVSTSGYYTVVPVSGYHPSCDVSKQNEALDFYWKTKVTGLVTAGTRHVEFDYRIDIPNQYNDPYYLLSGSDTWGTASGNNNSPTLQFPASIGTPAGDFTSGKSNPFKNPATYYSRQSGIWNATSGGVYTTWSLTGHNGAGVPTGTGLPRNYDNVIIGGIAGSRNDSVTVTADGITAAIITIRGSYTGNSRTPVLNIQNTTGHTIDIIRGAGKFSISTATIPASPTDFGDFLANDTAVFNYYGGSYTLPPTITSYPNLLITGGNTKTLNTASVIIRKNLLIADGANGGNALSLNGTSGDLTVYGTIHFLNGGKLLVPASATARTICVYGDINFRYGNTDNINAIEAVAGAGTIHKLNFYGSNIISGASNLTFNPAGTNKIDLYLKNPGSTTITFGTGTFSLNKIFIQKDVLNDIIYFNNNFTLNESGNNTAAKSLNLNTGTLILSDPANGAASTINLNLSSGGTSMFSLPSTSALILRNGSKVNISGNTSGSGIRLDGLLQAENSSQINLADGTAANTGYIEYSGSGKAAINLSGSSVLNTAQIRRSLSLTTGLLNYDQSGTSSVTVFGTGTAGIIDPSRGKFEVTGTGSSFNLSATATLSIINGGGTTFGDLYLRPELSSVTGGTVIFGQGSGSQTFKMDASIPLNNLSLFATGTPNTLQLMVNPLILNGSLILNNPGSTLDANNINVTISGDFINNGIYTTGTNTTFFNGTSQSVSGSNDPEFRNLTVSSAIKLALNRDITVNGNLSITAGLLETTIYNVILKGNVSNNGAYTNSISPAASRLYLNGTDIQQISGTGTFGRIELDNISGLRLGNSISLSDDFTLTNGIIDINQYLLTLGSDSEIGGTGFGPTKMIKLDGVLSNMGVRKFFNGTFTGEFVFPIGVSGKYTPATLTVNSTDAGYLQLKNIDSRHPATLSPFNVLNYYWEAESNIPDFEGNIKLQYIASDVTGTESQYVAARLIIPPGTGWSKAAPGPATDNVDETNHLISFDFPAGTNNLGGQYTSGHDTDLPSTIPVYNSNVISGNWEDPLSWTPVAPAGGPNGFAVIINPGHTIHANGNKRFAYKTTVNGTFDVATTYGHNLGTVDGTGTISMQHSNLPAGDFSTFFSCSGGTLIYGGNTSYTIVADRITSVRNLFFTGTGTRILPDKDLVICNQLLINGPVLDNQFNRKLSIGGSFDLVAGSFLSGSGSGATVSFNGSSAQTVSGFTSANSLNNLEINNSTGLTLNSEIQMKGNLLLSNGIITTSAANLLKMNDELSTVIPDGGTTASYINGPMSKKQFGGTDFTFPIGKSSRYGKLTLINPQTGIWESEYYNNPFGDLSVTGTLVKPSETEYWRITSPANGKTAAVQLRWDSQSDINPLTTSGGINDIRVAEYNGTDWIEKSSSVPSGDDTNGTVKTSSNISINNTGNPRFYSLGSVSAVKPTITLGITPEVCTGSLTALLPYTATTGNPNQYQLDFSAFAESAGFVDVSAWTALPASPITITVPSGVAVGTYVATITVRTSSPVNPSIGYPFTLTVSSNMTWTGSLSTNWNTPGNWSCGIVPTIANSVTIPNVANKPVLSSGSAGSVNNLTINAGSSLTVAGNTLQIAGAIANNGSFDVATGKIELRGSAAQILGLNVFSGNTIMDLTVNNPTGVTLLGSLNVTGILTAQNGNLATGGFLTLVSDAAGTALINGAGTGSVTGNVSMQRYLPSRFGYKYFSSPFQAATVNEFADDINLLAAFPSLYRYDESRTSAGWVDYTSPAGMLEPLQGYAVNFGSAVTATTVDMTGVVNNGNISRTLFNHNNPYTLGFNLVGNPYPSPVDWNAPGWTKTNIDDALYYFKSGGADEYSGTYSTYINGVSNDGVLNKNIIPSMQGFYVHVSNGSWPVTGTLAMNNSVRVTDLTHSFIKSDGTEAVPLIRVNAAFADDTTSIDPVVIYFNEKATASFDAYLDALKIMNTDPLTPNLYCVVPGEKNNLSINALHSHENYPLIIPVGLRIERKGKVLFTLQDNSLPESNIYFHDEATGKEQILNSTSRYSITLGDGDYNNRFSLRLYDKNSDPNENRAGLHLLNAYDLDGKLVADIFYLSGGKGMLMLHNISGQLLLRKDIFNTGFQEFNTSLGTGVYIVTFITGKFSETKKILIF